MVVCLSWVSYDPTKPKERKRAVRVSVTGTSIPSTTTREKGQLGMTFYSKVEHREPQDAKKALCVTRTNS
jgi:hypothetical protein